MAHRKTLAGLVAATILAGSTGVSYAATEIQWWHAFSGRLAELLTEQVEKFNASQSDYVVVASHKGNYSETLNAGIAAFRAGEQPHILQVFEVGTATMMSAKGAIKPVFEVMEETGKPFDPETYLAAVKGYYTTTDGKMLSLPYNSSTPVLYVNRDALTKAGLDPDMDLSTWDKVNEAMDAVKASGSSCPLTTAWQSWVHLENLSAYHNVPFATKENGFAGLDTELSFNGPVQVKHIEAMGQWAKDGKFIYAGRRNEGGARFRAGECAFFTESSAGYAGVKAEADFAFDIRPLPYWAGTEGAPQNTIIGGASLWVMAGHKDEEYAGVAEFLNFLSSADIQASWHQNTGYLPITMAAYEQTKDAGFYKENPGTDIAILQMTGKAPTANSKGLRLGSFDQIRGIIDEELEAVWSGDKTAQAALDNAVARGNQLLRRFEQANR
ncbi:sn-glycerol-3-phosphate ABC transporter substrate-binding protein UgpB [Stappia taiwanensis]|uniref:sn-glycerol-3-phosphate-binding periplasmic protein UgpB n=1 Tax=Stappia taiwanensis TaxID=992267 RepID=A0A838XTD6_9HYPH|nr:sn-glycerol-3-phosphate ABC transporter substrate-binding protein UgpB [Stappia taiwanensis]MBA4613695.1 sn-glycerol-3-phosphate ABC transporter substrate-binding protein UgpB [Stappia taiwanensis]GGE81304.1 ABC transporter substrate-binding protein [Stappia taiwanensis]